MLIEYVDLQCPICQEFESRELAPLVKKYVRPGKLKIKIQPWNDPRPTTASHDPLRGQKATIAAARQNKAFIFAEVLYDNQGVEGSGWLNDTMISKIAASVDRLRPYKLAKDANGGATRRVIKSITHWGMTHPNQMTGTPTLYLVHRTRAYEVLRDRSTAPREARSRDKRPAQVALVDESPMLVWRRRTWLAQCSRMSTVSNFPAAAEPAGVVLVDWRIAPPSSGSV